MEQSLLNVIKKRIQININYTTNIKCIIQIQDDWSNFISVKLNINILIRGEREKEKLPITWERLKKTQQDIINFLIRDATRKIINGERKEENRKIEHGIKCLEIKLQRNILRFLRKKRRVLKVSGNKQRKKGERFYPVCTGDERSVEKNRGENDKSSRNENVKLKSRCGEQLYDFSNYK